METKIGHYQIVSELGRGGMGVVYKAHEQSLNRYVAIKVLGQHLEEDSSYVQRFVREAQSAAKLNHPNIVQIYAINEDQGQHYFVMEYVQGTSLHSIIRQEGRIAATRAAHVAMQTAAGLAAAHEMGIIHRDIKPANILITEKGLVKIADFGLALAAGGASRLTATGMFMGTPGYLSPEQCLDKTVDSRTDIYSLGVTFYEMITGAMPFNADSPLALLRQIIEVEPPDIRELNPEVDETIRQIVQRMIAKNPEHRYQSCNELIEDLQGYLENSGISRHDLALLAAAPAVGSVEPAAAGAPETNRAVTLQDSATMVMNSGEQPPAANAAPPPPPGPANAPTEYIPEALTPPPQPNVTQNKSRTPVILLAVAAVILVALLGSAAVAWKSGALSRFLQRDTKQLAAQASVLETDGDEGTSALTGDSAGTLADQDNDESASLDSQSELEEGSDALAGMVATEGFNESVAEESAAARDVTSRQAPPPPTPKVAPAEPATSAGATAITQQPQPREPLPQAMPARGVVVVATGERLLAGAAESFVQKFLERRGVLVVDEARFPDVLDLLTRSDPQVSTLLKSLQGRARRMVLVNAEYLGDRPLLHHGGRDVVYRSRLRIQPFELANGESAGTGFDEVIEYNQLTVERKVEESLRRHIRDILR